MFSSITSQNLWNGKKIESPLSIPELLNIRIFQDDKVIGVYHLPEEVIIRSKTKIEIHDADGSLIKTYDLIERNLSWLENINTDCCEIILDLHVKDDNLQR